MTSTLGEENHVPKGLQSSSCMVEATSSLYLRRVTISFTPILTGADSQSQRMRSWSYLLFPDTYTSRHIATEKRKGSSSSYQLIQGSRGSPGLGRYAGRKEIAAGSQSDTHTHHHQAPPSSTNQFTTGKPSPEIKGGGK